ncbi:HNH endonuclease [Sphingomonas parapaucimobilis]|uniref:HNH endonuclease n=1 Tax=Sphingomonas parapaucimobilis TaxID=28213 RepID=UPI00391D2572
MHEDAPPPLTKAKRRQIPTEERAAIWEAHNKRCPYTGDLIGFAELEIDHVVPVTIAPDELARLKRDKIIGDDFDLNGLGNLLPTKRFPNGTKSDRIRSNNVLINFLDVARQHRAQIETQLAAALDERKTLTAYLRLKAKADRNSIEVEDVVDVHRQQEGSTRLRHAPELAGAEDVTVLNATLAGDLMVKPFALGGGLIDEVVLRDDDGNKVVCANCVEFVAAQQKGYWPESQFDINCYGMAERNCAMLAALETATFAPTSAIRYPRVTCRNLDRWSSAWVRRVCFEFDPAKDGPLFDRCPTIAHLVAEGACTVVEQDDWRVRLEPAGGFGLALSELFRADLDGDGEEEILVFDLLYATGGTLRAGSVAIAKPDVDGILQPASNDEAADG